MLYWITIYLLRLLFWSFTRFHVKGVEHIPRKNGFLIVSNHISHFDPPILSSACPRAIDWMGSEILFRGAISNLFFQRCHVIKVRQYEADQNALREAIRRTKFGRGVGLFPEGGIRAGEKSLLGSHSKLYDGAFMIAAMSRVPVIPCLVIGSDRLYNPRFLFRRAPLWVRIGSPIAVEGHGREEVNRLKKLFIEAFHRLVKELQAEGVVRKKDWPQTPQQRNPKIPPPQQSR